MEPEWPTPSVPKGKGKQAHLGPERTAALKLLTARSSWLYVIGFMVVLPVFRPILRRWPMLAAAHTERARTLRAMAKAGAKAPGARSKQPYEQVAIKDENRPQPLQHPFTGALAQGTRDPARAGGRGVHTLHPSTLDHMKKVYFIKGLLMIGMPHGSVDEIVELAERQLGPDWMDCTKKGKEDAKITLTIGGEKGSNSSTVPQALLPPTLFGLVATASISNMALEVLRDNQDHNTFLPPQMWMAEQMAPLTAVCWLAYATASNTEYNQLPANMTFGQLPLMGSSLVEAFAASFPVDGACDRLAALVAPPLDLPVAQMQALRSAYAADPANGPYLALVCTFQEGDGGGLQVTPSTLPLQMAGAAVAASAAGAAKEEEEEETVAESEPPNMTGGMLEPDEEEAIDLVSQDPDA